MVQRSLLWVSANKVERCYVLLRGFEGVGVISVCAFLVLAYFTVTAFKQSSCDVFSA